MAIGTSFLPNPQSGAVPELFDQLTPDDPDMAVFREMYEAVSPDGAAHWPVVVDRMVEMFRIEPDIALEDLGRIGAPTLVLVGDDDIITLEHTIALYRAIPGSQLAVVPGTSHAVPMEKPAEVNRIVLDFLAHEPTPTMMPVRRARTAGPAGRPSRLRHGLSLVEVTAGSSRRTRRPRAVRRPWWPRPGRSLRRPPCSRSPPVRSGVAAGSAAGTCA